MRVLVIESDLMWISRLRQSLPALGHEPVFCAAAHEPLGEFDAAIINLAAKNTDFPGVVTKLKQAGMFVIGHAGHKDKELLEAGRAAGCDLVVTNGKLSLNPAQCGPLGSSKL